MAIKSIADGASEAETKLLEKECLLLARLRHPNLVRLCGIAEDEMGELCMVMELASLGSLRAELDTKVESGQYCTRVTVMRCDCQML